MASKKERRLEKEIKMLKERLDGKIRDCKEESRLKDEFLNVITHELKTPLTPIAANLDLLAAGDVGRLSAKQLERLKIVVRNTKRLHDIVDNMLDIERIDANKIMLNNEKIQVNNVAREVLEDVEIAARRRGILLTSKFQKLPVVYADRTRLKECISNLLNNALKYTGSGSITLTTEGHGNFVKVSVADTGIGIKKEFVKKLFHKFYQTGQREIDGAKGVGLGLYSVKKIIEMEEGKVGVSTKAGIGSIFWFTLPTANFTRGDK